MKERYCDYIKILLLKLRKNLKEIVLKFSLLKLGLNPRSSAVIGIFNQEITLILLKSIRACKK